MSAYFVTATGTDIGKTFVTAGLVRAHRRRGRDAGAVKPVVSGFDMADAAASDPGVLLSAMDRRADEDEIGCISPWRFAAPLSPDMAAAREGRSIEFEALIRYSRDAIACTPGTLFIEGVGGIMVPLDARRTVLDWMAALRLPLVIVTGSYLGAISHTLTALDVLNRYQLAIAALVVNESQGSTVGFGDTVETIARFVGGVPVHSIRRNPGACAFDDLADALH